MLKQFIFITLLLAFVSVWSQSEKVKQLETKVARCNDALQYEKSIQLISNFINYPEATAYDKYYCNLLKSYTYKRLFNYTKTLYYIEEALKEGLKSDRVEEVKNNVLAEKSFVYFDTEDYKKALVLINQLKQSNFEYIPAQTKAWLIMQEGYILMLNKKYTQSEKTLDKAISVLKNTSPSDLPNIYAKKIELYNEMKQYEKRDATFELALVNTKKHKKIKYEMYLYQVMKNVYKKNGDYKNAFYKQNIYDSINDFYNATNKNADIELLEKRISDEKQNLQLKNDQYVKYILYGCIVFLLLILYFTVQLYRTNKDKKVLIEKENTRIHNEIERLTKKLDEKGTNTLDLSKFNLTERQKEIIQLIKLGKSNKEIANDLCISENTIKYHLKVLYEILDVEHRSEIKP